MRQSTAVLAWIYALPSVFSLQVSPGSPCSALCIADDRGDVFSPDSSSTEATEITCRDEQYSSTNKGKKFKNCMECLEKSTWSNGAESDAQWLTYNLRFTISACLFDVPKAVDEDSVTSDEGKADTERSDDDQKSCATDSTCRPIKDALIHDRLDPKSNDTYGFCDTNDGSLMGKSFNGCLECLRGSDQQAYMANFMIALTGGCAYRPTDGSRLHIVGDLFSRDEVGISAPDLEGNSGKGDEEPAAANKTTDDGSQPMSKAKVGMISGISGGASLVISGAVFMLWRQRRRRKHFRMSNSTQGNHRYLPGAMSGTYFNPYQASARPNETTQEYYIEKHGSESLEQVGSVYSSSRNTVLACGLPVHPAYIPTIKSKSSLRDEASPQQPASPEPDDARSVSQSHSSRVSHENESSRSLPLRDFLPASPAPIHSRSVTGPGASARGTTPRRAPSTLKSRRDPSAQEPSTPRSRGQPAAPSTPRSRGQSSTAPSTPRSRGQSSAAPSTPRSRGQSSAPSRSGSRARPRSSRQDEILLTGNMLEALELPFPESSRATPEPETLDLPLRMIASPSPVPSTSSVDGQRGRRKQRPQQLNLCGKPSSSTKNIRRLPAIDPSPRT